MRSLLLQGTRRAARCKVCCTQALCSIVRALTLLRCCKVSSCLWGALGCRFCGGRCHCCCCWSSWCRCVWSLASFMKRAACLCTLFSIESWLWTLPIQVKELYSMTGFTCILYSFMRLSACEGVLLGTGVSP